MKRDFNNEQIEVLRAKDKRLLVSASAGSGKTTVMIEKILGLIREGNSLEMMLISTFTKAAAADIKAKLYDALHKERTNPHIREQLELIPLADVSNLHSFCQRQITSYFYRLGIDPSFTVIDEAESICLISECTDEAVEEEILAQNPDFLRLYDILLSGRRDDALKNYVKEIHSFAMLQTEPELFLSRTFPPSGEKVKQRLLENIERKKRSLIKRLSELQQLNGAAGFTRNQPLIDELVDFVEQRQQTLTRAYGKIPAEFAQLNFVFAQLKDEAKKLQDERAELEAMSFEEGEDANAAVLRRLAKRLYELYAQKKADKSALDFSDLEHFMLRLLVDEETRREITDKYKYIFVDEYQDINPIQEEILLKISQNATAFYVGDLKQSIYAFRGCEPQIFLDRYKRYTADPSEGRAIKLNSNYRSDARILELCNDLFGEIMTEEFGGISYKKDGMFVSGKGNIGFEPELVVVRDSVSSAQIQPPVYSVREAGFDAVEKLVDAEQNLILYKILKLMLGNIEEDGMARPVSLSDIVILVRSGGEYVNKLAAKLRKAGIEVSVGERLSFVSEHTTSVLIAFLKLLDNFDSDIALLSVMRSVFGGFTDAELAAIRREDVYSEYFFEAARRYKKDDEIGTRLKAFFQKIDDYYELSRHLRVDELLGKIVADHDYFKHVFSLAGGKAKAELLDNFLSFAESCPYKRSIFGFLKYLSGGVTPEVCPPKSDAVRIMTVHSSKGLEFPLVILANMGKKFNLKDSYSRVILDKEYGICIKEFDDESRTVLDSPLRRAASIKSRQTMLEEELRILYVALTRAKNGLFIFGSVDEGDKYFQLFEVGNFVDFSSASNALTWMLPIMPKYANFFRVSDCSVEIDSQSSDDRPIFASHDERLSSKIQQRINHVYPHQHAIRKTFVTAAAKTDKSDITPVYSTKDDRAIDRGNAFHKAMELMDFCADFSPQWESLSPEIKQLLSIEELKAATATIKSLAKNKSIYKEIPFILNHPLAGLVKDETIVESKEKVLIQGVIDLLLVEGDEATIVDYKTTKQQNLITNEYKTQLRIYKTAVQKILNKTVTKTYIYSTDLSTLIEINTD